VRRAFQEGNLIFERNWPYTYAKFNATAVRRSERKFGVAPIPGLTGPGTRRWAGTTWAISKFTRHPPLEDRAQLHQVHHRLR